MTDEQANCPMGNNNQEPQTVADFAELLIAERGGRDRFNAIQVRIASTIALALRDPSRIEPSVIRDLMSMLPPVAKPTGSIPTKLVIEFLDTEPSTVERVLHERIAELEKQLAAQGGAVVERGLPDPADGELAHQRPPVGHGESLPEQGNVVPLRSKPDAASVWGTLAQAMNTSGYAPGIAHGSEYLPPDRFDETGKRIS
jgi:hypothetical protein